MKGFTILIVDEHGCSSRSIFISHATLGVAIGIGTVLVFLGMALGFHS